MAKKKTSRTGRSTGGKSVNSRKRTTVTASTGNGASRSSKKKTAKRSRTTSATGKKASTGKKAATRKKAATGKKATTKKSTTRKAATSKKSTAKKAGTSKKTTQKAGSRSVKKAGQKAGKSPLTKKEREKYRGLLLLRRAEILGDMSSMSEEALGADSSNLSHMPIHMADVSSDGYERELMLGLVESERQVIREIDEALQRIAEGTYGVCEATGKPIAKSRLNAKPWAKYCIEAAREMERTNGPPR